MKLLYGDRAAREVSGRIGEPTATTTTLVAIPPDRRVDGMVVMVLEDSTPWVFDADSDETPAADILDVDDGDGQWLSLVAGITATLATDTPAALGVAATAGAGSTASKVDRVHAWAQKKTVTIGHADLTDADDGDPQSINIGTALPAGAIVLAL